MPLASGDIEYRLSGGSSNTDVDGSVGGAISSTEVTSGALHNLFDVVSSSEASAGDTEYRCIYVINNYSGSPIIQAQNILTFIQSATPSSDSELSLGLSAQGIDTTATAVADESSAPAGVTFYASSASPNILSLPDMNPGQYIGVWIRRVISSSASAYTNDGATIRTTFDTAG